MMRSTPKIRDSPDATRPYTPPSRRPLTAACSRRSAVTSCGGSAAPPRNGEDRLGLGEARGTDHDGLAGLHLQERRRRVHVLAGLVELDGVLRQDVIGEVRLRQRVAQLVTVRRAG